MAPPPALLALAHPDRNNATLLERALVAHRTHEAHSRIEGLTRALIAARDSIDNLPVRERDFVWGRAFVTAARELHDHLSKETGLRGAAFAPVVADLGALLDEHDAA
ncbi:hypothetical protein [Streptomyces sp. NPDC000405]|uniref:hypothetical protein n=1 Tax=Streptomyces sp. NPDC000405 TaxID=3161033 RepID=UPI00398D665E